MKKLIVSVLCLLGAYHVAFSQAENTSAQKNATNFTRDVVPGTQIYTFDPGKGRMQGDPYLIDKWVSAEVKTQSDENSYLMDSVKLNLLNDRLEIIENGKLKMMLGAEIKEIQLFRPNRKLKAVNAKYYTYEGTPLNSFLEVVEEGKVQLLKRIVMTIKEANYVLALNIGSRSDEIIREDKFYFAEEGELYLVEGKKSVIKFFDAKSVDVRELIKKPEYWFRSEEGLQNLVRYYNSK